MKIVKGKFLDSEVNQHPWVSKDDIGELTPIPFQGYLIKETDLSISITVSPNVDADEYAAPLTIPKCAITDGPYYEEV